MKTAFTKDFRKTLKKIKDDQLRKAIFEAVVECKAAKDLRKFPILKNLLVTKPHIE